MPTRIQVKRGSSDPSGLTTGEFGFNTTNSTLFIGSTASGSQRWIGGEVTGGTDMGAGSAASQTRVPTQNAVYQYARNNFVWSFNGLTGAVGGVSAAQANTFTALQTFTGGISAAGGITLNGAVTGATATFSGAVESNAGFRIGAGAINAQTAGYTLAAGDNGKVITMNSSSALTLTAGTAVGATGFSCTVIQLGTGQVTIAASGTTLNSYNGLKIQGQHGAASIVCYQTNVFNVAGNLTT